MKRFATALIALTLLTATAPTASAARSAPGGGPPGHTPAAATTPTKPVAPKTDPDFGASDKIVAAWRAHRLTDDQLVRYGVQWLIGDPNLPTQWRAEQPLGELSVGYQAFLDTKVAKADPATRSWVADVFRGERKSAPAKPAAQAAPAGKAAATLPTDPQNECGLDVKFLLESYSCRYRTANVRIYYNIATDGTHQNRAVPGLFTRTSNTPDGILQLVQGAEAAFTAYRDKLGYQITLPDPLPIWVGAKPAEVNNTALTWPFDNIGEGKGSAVVMLPSDLSTGRATPKTQYNYLPRHEIFHAFQYHYIPNSQLLWNVGATNWWMEATAEWATRKSYQLVPTYYGEPGEDAFHARNNDLFFGAPGRAVNAWDGLAKSRQYAANPFAEYLTERVDSAFVRRTWENYGAGDGTAMSAILKTLGDAKADVSGLLTDFAVANYRLDTPATVYAPGPGNYVQLPGYTEPQASSLWRDLLQASTGFPTAGDAYAPARPAHQSWELGWHGDKPTSTNAQSADLRPGGAFYADLVPQGLLPAPDDRGVLKVHVDPNPNLTYRLLSWRRTGVGGSTTYPTIGQLDYLDAKGDGTVRIDDPATVVTLVVTRVDLIAEPRDAEQNVLPVKWNAGLLPDPNTSLNIDGDPGTATPLYNAQHNWFAFDTTPGQTFYLAGSVPEYATVYLRAPNGNVLRSDLAESAARRHMFGGSEFTSPNGGRYYVEVMPRWNSATTAATVRVLSEVPTVQASIDGDQVAPTTQKWGQQVKTTFTATAGQNVYFAGSAPGVTYYELFDPAGKSLRSDTQTSSARVALLNRMTLATAGTYTVRTRLSPAQPNTSEFRVLGDIPTVPATLDGDAVTLTGPKWGQITRVTFEAGANQLFYAAGQGNLYRHWRLVDPNGQEVTSGTEWYSTRTTVIDPRRLPAAGTYALEIDPQFGDDQTTTVQLYGSVDIVDTSVGGPGVSLTLPPGGRQGVVRFSGTAGQTINVTGQAPYLSNLELDDTSGRYLTSTDVLVQSGPVSFFSGRSLPATGQYKIWIKPPTDRSTPSTIDVSVTSAS
ncbi:hypothetical protein [Embleya sp. AB8]|uniref:hypothetical protein n=1 Tax=Embleya sp. AB8 TaxID=3156304 RepID=UPI003C765903